MNFSDTFDLRRRLNDTVIAMTRSMEEIMREVIGQVHQSDADNTSNTNLRCAVSRCSTGGFHILYRSFTGYPIAPKANLTRTA